MPRPDANDAAAIYERAAATLRVDSPSVSNLSYPEYPPFGDAWDDLAQRAWDANESARDIVREARTVNTAGWPKGLKALGGCRRVANDLGDAALYQHLHGDDRGALETVADLRHLAQLLQSDGDPKVPHQLVGAGIAAMTMHRVMIIASNINLSERAEGGSVSTAEVKALIGELLEQPSPDELTGGMTGFADPSSAGRALETFKRVNAEQSFAAMSLACAVFKFENGRWPDDLDELRGALPADADVPLDPWGDGDETFGYALIKHALPDGSDRPLLYDRGESRDGLMYRIDAPQYSFYLGDGSGKKFADQKQGGEFRDVSLWQPAPRPKGEPTLAPLP